MSNSKKISVEGIELVYIKRKNKRIFGPFPTKKVFSLIKNGKLSKGEFISQDRENWHEISEVKEFSSLFTDEGESSSELPGLKGSSELPGLKGSSELPGLKGSSELPGLKGSSELPGLKGSSELPGLKGSSELPGVRSNLPGSRGDLPGVRSNLPGSRGDLPGVRSDLPGSRGDLPGVRSDLPGSRGDENDFDKNEKQKIKLNELDNIFDENNESPSFDSLLKEDKIKKFEVEDESLDINSFSEEITHPIEKEDENLFLNQDRADSIEIENIDEKGGDEEELPHFINSVEKAKQKKKTSSLSKVEKKSNIKILLGLILLLVAGLSVEWTFNIFGFFGKNKQKNTPQISKKSQKNKLSNKVVKKKQKKQLERIMTWKFDKLMEDSKSQNNEGCQAALLLAYHHDYLDKLDNCGKIVKNKPVYNGSNLKISMDILRFLLLQRGYSAQIKNKIYAGNVLDTQKNNLSSMLEKKISQNRKDNFWNYLMVLFLMENNQYALAREKLNMISSNLVKEHFAINLLKARCGEKKININKFNDIEKKLLKIAENAFKLEKIQNKGFFPPLTEKLAQSFAPQKKELELFGPRYSVLAMATRAYNRWLQGYFSNSWSLCKEILEINKFNKIASTTCLNIFSYNSLFKKIDTTFIKPDKDWVLPYKIATYLNLNRQIKAMALTTDLKKNDQDLFKEIYPLVYAQKNKGEIESQVSMKDLFSKNTKKSAFYIYLTMWNNRELIEYYSDILGEAKQKEGEILKSFLKLLKIFKRNECKKYNQEFVKFEKNTEIAEGFIHPFRALNLLCLFELKKYDKIEKILVKKDKEYIYTSRGAAVVISFFLHQKNYQKLENSIRRMEKEASDIYYYETAARAYINGSRKDRLHRGKFFLDKLLDLDSKNYKGLFLLGIISIESGKFKKGEKLLRTIFENKKPSIDKIMAWVDSEVKMNRYKSAVEALDYGLTIHKNNDKLYFRKGKLYSDQNVPSKSIKTLKKISDKSEVVFNKYYLLGKNYLKMRDNRKAEKALAQALTHKQNSPEVNFLYGKVLLTRGKISKSTVYLNKSLNIQVVEKKEEKKKFYWVEEAHRLLGGIYKEKNNRKKAVYHLLKYAQMVPEGPLKDEAMKMLRSLGGDH